MGRKAQAEGQFDRAIDDAVEAMAGDLVRDRRDVHRHAESAWTEFWTTAFIAQRLRALGYKVDVGKSVCLGEARMGLPPDDALDAQWRRARDQGADGESLEAMRGGFTGVVGARPGADGPTIALRFDIDALDLVESNDRAHRPAREGFASLNPGRAHACGHDGHVAIGLGVAGVLSALPNKLPCTVRLLFQPAEEGVRGARSMVAAGHLNDVDAVIGCHLLTGWAVGELAPGLGGYAATRKFDVVFRGEAAHAGARPEGGRNALLAAATAVVHLHALPRHHGGFTRVHVGRMEAGTGRNVIADRALLVAEVRGETHAVCESMYGRAEQVVRAAAAMYGCDVELRAMGQADTAQSDPTLAQLVENVARRTGEFAFHSVYEIGGSEDFTEMMRAVQTHGGLAINIGIGADFHGTRRSDVDRKGVLALHSASFDVDERALGVGVRLLCRLVTDLAMGMEAGRRTGGLDKRGRTRY